MIKKLLLITAIMASYSNMYSMHEPLTLNQIATAPASSIPYIPVPLPMPESNTGLVAHAISTDMSISTVHMPPSPHQNSAVPKRPFAMGLTVEPSTVASLGGLAGMVAAIYLIKQGIELASVYDTNETIQNNKNKQGKILIASGTCMLAASIVCIFNKHCFGN